MTAGLKKSFAVFTVMAFVFSAFSLYPQDKPKPGGLKGFVYWADTKEPVKDAVVILRNTADNKEYKSEKTPKDGSYFIPNLPPGNYVVAIKKDDNTYNIDGFLRITSNLTDTATFFLSENKKMAIWFPKGFFKKPGSLAWILGGTAILEGIIFILIKTKEKECSPTKR